MKVLIIGSGGREHALAWACHRSPIRPQLVCAPGNGGTARFAKNVDIAVEDLDDLEDFVRDQRFDLVVVGPEAPLVKGIADRLAARGFRVFGPGREAAWIEGSKAFAKRMMAQAAIPTAEFAVFSSAESARRYIESRGAPVVVKASGLAAGKGVMVCQTVDQALAAVDEVMVRRVFGSAGDEVVVEDCLEGRELSLLAIADGKDFLVLPPARDYKRALDGDQGPNTGGMGAHCPLEDVDDPWISRAVREVIEPALAKLAESGNPYRGCLYAGLMDVQGAPMVLEFNCRFGDPEAQAIIPLLKIDLLELMAETAEGALVGWLKRNLVTNKDFRRVTRDGYAMTVVAAVEGYPGTYQRGLPITHLPSDDDDLIVFHAGTTWRDKQLVTDGGRVVAVTGLGDTAAAAAVRAYEGVNQVTFPGVRFRRDIGGRVWL